MAQKSFDYSKWDKIELSDDESDLHPNIDKDSWFRLKHRTRLEREAKEDEEKKEINELNARDGNRIKIIKARLDGLKSNEPDEDAEFEDTEALALELQELEEAVKKRLQRVEEIDERRKWSSDNICKTVEEKTVVSTGQAASLRADDFKPTGLTEKQMKEREAAEQAEKAKKTSSGEESSTTLPSPPSTTSSSSSTTTAPPPAASSSSSSSSSSSKPAVGPRPQSDRTAVISYNDFVLTHEDLLETYSVIEDLEKTEEFIFKNCDILLHEHSQSYMLLSSLEDEMNGKKQRMRLVCRQSQILSHITELGTSMHLDPRDVVRPFFRRISEPAHFQAFKQAVDQFIVKIQERAVVKRREMDRERREDERRQMRENNKDVPLGPGGLNPYEVLDMLPDPLREVFESESVEELQRVLSTMPAKEAKKWMKMCVDSGLWVAQDTSVYDDVEGEDEEDAKPASSGAGKTTQPASSADDIE